MSGRVSISVRLCYSLSFIKKNGRRNAPPAGRGSRSEVLTQRPTTSFEVLTVVAVFKTTM